jgi:hypothetical protein
MIVGRVIATIVDTVVAVFIAWRNTKPINRIIAELNEARPLNPGSAFEMAEREGFEPSVEVSPHTRLAGERLQPARPSLRLPIPKLIVSNFA